MAKPQKKENVRIRKKKGFTQVQNWAVDDLNLSDKALGLYTRIQRWITFEAPGFECSKAFIRTKTPSGEKAFDSAWNELKECGYLKMYCIPPANWEAELLDEPEPGPHTFYLNSDGEIKSTNVDRAEKKKAAEKKKSSLKKRGGMQKKEAEPASDEGSVYYPQKRGNTKSSNTIKGNTKSSNTNSTDTKSSDTNGGKNINTSSNTSFNTSLNPMDKNYQSINHYEGELEDNHAASGNESQIGRVIDMALIDEVKEQIQFDLLSQDGIMQEGISAEDLDMAVDALVALKAANTPQEFSGNTYSAEFIRHRADSVKMEHIQYVFDCFYEHREKVYNVKRYLTTAIFNAPATMGAYYANAVRSKGLI